MVLLGFGGLGSSLVIRPYVHLAVIRFVVVRSVMYHVNPPPPPLQTPVAPP